MDPGASRSRADVGRFFISGQNRDADLELRATLIAFFNNAKQGEEFAQCVFPARRRFLMKALNLTDTDLKPAACPQYDNFRKRLDAHSVSLVFSSYFLNNPSSAFGHTFIRLNHARAAEPSDTGVLHSRDPYELLDFGAGYGANPTTRNPLLYAFYGVFGLFPGSWMITPYYFKVREYNDFDSRDLWSYDLRLSQEQVDMLVAHLWEVGHTTFPYYYVSRNCSFYVLSLLEAADPGLNLLGHLHAAVAPVDTIRAAFAEPGFVVGTSYRPSIHTQLQQRFESLDEESKKLALEFIKSERIPSISASVSDKQRAAVLDTVIDYEDFQSRKEPDGVSELRQNLLRERSRIDAQPQKLVIVPDETMRPESSHGGMRFGVFSGYDSLDAGYLQIDYRVGQHSFSDPPNGYPDFAELEGLAFSARYDVSSRMFELNQAKLFHVASLTPWSTLEKPISWELLLGTTTVQDDRCERCFAGDLELGGGFTLPIARKSLLSVNATAQLLATDHFTGSFFQMAAGPRIRLVLRPFSSWQAVFTSDYFFNFYNLRAGDSYDWSNSLRLQFNLSEALGLATELRSLQNKLSSQGIDGMLGVTYLF